MLFNHAHSHSHSASNPPSNSHSPTQSSSTPSTDDPRSEPDPSAANIHSSTSTASSTNSPVIQPDLHRLFNNWQPSSSPAIQPSSTPGPIIINNINNSTNNSNNQIIHPIPQLIHHHSFPIHNPACNNQNNPNLSISSAAPPCSAPAWHPSTQSELINPFSQPFPPLHTQVIPPFHAHPQHQPDLLINLTPSLNSHLIVNQDPNQPAQPFIPSPSSPSSLAHPLYQHQFNHPNPVSSPVDQSFFHPHLPHLTHSHPPNGWHPTFDGGYPTPLYDPFQIKHRRRTTPAQLGVLEAQFETNCKPDVVLRKQLADQLDMTPREVQVWFQNRRAKTKKLEKRAEQESGKGSETEASAVPVSRPPTSPPASIYLSPPSSRAAALPVMHESPEELRLGPLPSTVRVAGEPEEGEEGQHHRIEADRRHRSHSLHHHPYYLPPGNLFPGGSSAFASLFAARALAQTQQQFKFSDAADEQALGAGRRDSRTSVASSTATATESNLVHTPTTPDFGLEDAMAAGSLPEGYDPRRRSSCPAEFIQSFGHFGLTQLGGALGPQTVHEGTRPGGEAADQTPNWLDGPAVSTVSFGGPQTILSWASAGSVGGSEEEWKTEGGREGIQRRHSLASINCTADLDGIGVSESGLTGAGGGDGISGFANKMTEGFEKTLTPTPTTGAGTGVGGPRGYGRRASTSVLNSIEEHPGNLWSS